MHNTAHSNEQRVIELDASIDKWRAANDNDTHDILRCVRKIISDTTNQSRRRDKATKVKTIVGLTVIHRNKAELTDPR